MRATRPAGRPQASGTSPTTRHARSTSARVPAYTSPTHAFYFGQDATCRYGAENDTRTSGTLTSPHYTGATGATAFTFQSCLTTEGDYCPNDIGSVEVSYDDGAKWTMLEACVPDTPGTFQQVHYAISLAGDTVRFRFRFRFRFDGNLNGYPGWFIHDLAVVTSA